MLTADWGSCKFQMGGHGLERCSDAQRAGVLADFPEDLSSVTPVLRDGYPTSNFFGTKHTHGEQGIHADKRLIHIK